MFKFEPDPVFKFTVMIPVPGGDPEELKLHGRRWLRSRISRAHEEGMTFDAIVAEGVVGWDDVDADFSPGAMSTLLENYPLAARTIAQGLIAAQTESKSGN